MNLSTFTSRALLMGVILSSALNLRAQAPSAPGSIQPSNPSTAPAQLHRASVPTNNGWHARQGQYFQRNYGVDIQGVQRVASGEMLAFRYAILDPAKAKAFNDKKNSAYLIDEKTGAKLTVPQMEKVGALRTTNTPQEGRMYWIVFANTGRIVTAGSTVDVVIGDIHVNGLTVEAK